MSVFDGLDELRAALRSLPADLAAEATTIVQQAAVGAKADMQYPATAAELTEHLVVDTVDGGPYGAAARVRNTSRMAFWFENGTEARHYITKAHGVRHELGRMLPGHYFLPPVIRRRAAMYQQLKALVERHGLTVTGTP